MASMFPASLIGYHKSRAEETLYYKFKEQLNDEYLVFHSVAWLLPARPGHRPGDGESDFIVLHPEKGILTIEARRCRLRASSNSNCSSVSLIR